MKSFDRYIREQRELNINDLVLEGYLATFTDLEWLNYYYCGDKHRRSWGGRYVDTWSSAQNIFRMENIPMDSYKDQRATLKSNKAISDIHSERYKVRSGDIYYSIRFKYDASQDEFRKQAIDDEDAREKKKAEEFKKAVEAADTSKYTTDEKHIAKMKAYFNKRSDPERLVKSIKDNNKLVARWIAAIKIGWEDAISVFGSEVEERKLLTHVEVVAYTEKYGVEDEKVDDSDMKILGKTEKKLVDSWITKSLYKWLETQPVEIEWVEVFTGARTQGGKDAMSRNGRAWTEGFTMKVTKDGKTKQITFDIVTNEGGGLYGYCMDYQIVNLKEFKEMLTRTFNNL